MQQPIFPGFGLLAALISGIAFASSGNYLIRRVATINNCSLDDDIFNDL
jgi:hypothetical protein